MGIGFFILFFKTLRKIETFFSEFAFSSLKKKLNAVKWVFISVGYRFSSSFWSDFLISVTGSCWNGWPPWTQRKYSK